MTDYSAEAARVFELLLNRIGESAPQPRLHATQRVLELLGDPQNMYKIVHITGTNGKTSTARMIESLIRSYGLRPGLMTSPHLVKVNERIVIDGEPISDEAFVYNWNDIERYVLMADAELVANGEEPLTYFEALTVLAFASFADAPVDVAILEVGMGGEWDSTNVADGDVAVFAPISLDHMERLGNTIEEIAKTKSGIIKSGAFVVSSAQPAEALAVLKDKASSTADSFKSYGADFEVLESTPDILGQKVSIRTLAGEYSDLNLPVHGYYQAENAALAIAAVEAFLGGGEQRIMDDVVRAAFADFSSPGRLQVVSREPLVILDAAHNPGGAESLVQSLKTSFGSPYVIAIISILADKDARGLLEALDSSVVEVIITQSSSPRATPAEKLAELAREIFGADRVKVQANPQWALAEATLALPEGQKSAILVTGSITLVGEVLALKQIEAEQDV